MATDLITKLEEAGEGSRALDCEIARLFGWHRVEPRFARNKHGGWIAPEDFIGLWSDGSPKLDSMHGTTIYRDPHRFTQSLDAALALAERVLPGWHVTTSTHRCLLCEFEGNCADLGPANATVSQQMDDLGNYDGETAAHKHASTPALALCAAILRASEQERGG